MPQALVQDVRQARLLQVGEVFSIVDMPLWIKIAVTDFDGMVEVIGRHRIKGAHPMQ